MVIASAQEHFISFIALWKRSSSANNASSLREIEMRKIKRVLHHVTLIITNKNIR